MSRTEATVVLVLLLLLLSTCLFGGLQALRSWRSAC